MVFANDTLTAVPGIRVGHATEPGGRSGCTVVLGPFRGAVELRGLASGTRELHVLAPEHLVPRVHAICLTGGSAFGLAAADGVVGWLAERGIGYDTGVALVPLVPAAVIFDLAPGVGRPDAALGRAACEAATDGPVAGGRVGAGAGATVGKLGGRERAVPGGLGSAVRRAAAWTVGALAVVNALGDVIDAEGRVVAGGGGGGEEAGRASADGVREPFAPSPGTNTTLAVVATDASLSRIDLVRAGRVAANAFARRIVPVHTPFDGDVLFTLSTSETADERGSADVLAVGMAACAALEEAITAAVRPAGRS